MFAARIRDFLGPLLFYAFPVLHMQLENVFVEMDVRLGAHNDDDDDNDKYNYYNQCLERAGWERFD